MPTNAMHSALPTQTGFDSRYDKRLYNKRRWANKLGLGFAMSAMVFGRTGRGYKIADRLQCGVENDT